MPGVAARTFVTLSEHGMSVSLITQSSSEQSICFTVPEKESSAAREHLERAFAAEIARREVDSVQVQLGMATVAVVGLGMAGTPGIAGRVFTALAASDINLVAIAQGSSELNISFVVEASDAAPGPAGHPRWLSAVQDRGRAGHADHRPRRGHSRVRRDRPYPGWSARPEEGEDGKNAPIRVVGVVDRSGFVFDARGLVARRMEALASWKEQGKELAAAPGGQPGTPAQAVAFFARHALARPVLVDATAAETGPVLAGALKSGMDLVLANKRPLSGAKTERDALLALAQAHGRRIRFEATVGAGLPVLDTYRKLVDSGDKVLKIEGCVSGTLGFLFTELGRGRRFSEAVRTAMERRFTEPDPRDDLSGADVGRKALILGRLLGYAGEPGDVVIESLVPGLGPGHDPGAIRDRARVLGRGVENAGSGRPGQAGGASLRGHGHPQPDPGWSAERRWSQPVRRAEGDRQPDRLHHRPIPQPARDTGGGRGASGHRRRRAQRHFGAGELVMKLLADRHA